MGYPKFGLTTINLSYQPLLKILLSILFIALFAQISINVPVGESDIPITGQTFIVLLIAYILQRKLGTLAVFGYVVIGTLGVPVFADWKSGWSVLFGGSGGFLIGFILAAYVVGFLGEKDWPKSFGKSLLAMTIGTMIILFFGIGRLTFLYSFEKGLTYGFYPFWKGAIIKIVLGASILPLYHYWKSSATQ